MTNYTWTDDAMRGGSACDVDKVADNLMHLKYNAGGLLPVNDLGTKTTSFTLEPNKIDMVNITASLTISLPTTGFISGVENKCILDFSLIIGCTITLPTGTLIIWNGTAPTSFFVTTSGNENKARNVLTFTTRDAGITWKAEYKTYGGVLTTFIRPNLTANGTLGGSSFAVAARGEGTPAYRAVDGVIASGSSWEDTSLAGSYYIIYNPIPIQVSSFDITNYIGGTINYNITAGGVYGSNDNTLYTFLNSFTNSNVTNGSTWNLPITEVNKGFYKYYKLSFTATYGGCAPLTTELGINAQYIAT